VFDVKLHVLCHGASLDLATRRPAMSNMSPDRA